MNSPSLTRRSFLKSSALLAAASAVPTVLLRGQAAGAAPLMAYIGTFTAPLKNMLATQVDLPPGNGRGIHIFRVDRNTGALTAAGLYESGLSPNCIVPNPAGTRIYATNETEHIGEAQEGSVSAFEVDPRDGQLRLLNTIRSGGKGPTHASLHPSGKFLFVANYFGGTVAVLPVLSDGRLGEPTDVKVDAGPIGPTRAKNAPPGSFAISGHDHTHAHMIQPDPAGRFVLHADLGQDRIYSWKFDAGAGALVPNDPPFVALPPGDGPRHFHFHPNGRWLYSLQEEGSNIVLFDYDGASGRMTSRQTISSLPPGYAGSNFCSAILVSADGKFVYAGNRLHDSIGIFAIGADGRLTFVAEEWTRGDYPRSFNFDPSGRLLYSLNQRADNVAVFKVDAASGKLAFTGQYVPVGNPSSIAFVELAKRG
jgi:6-phosphogluconolactonase